jgi:hypothetical protein
MPTGEIRGFIVEEVQKQIAPLASTVGRMDKRLRSLYRNGTDPGGPPGFLETARQEDKEKISELLDHQREQITRLEKVENALNNAELVRQTQATSVADKVDASEKKFKKRLGWATLTLAILQIINILWDHRAGIIKSLSVVPSNPVVQSTQIIPQNATIHAH